MGKACLAMDYVDQSQLNDTAWFGPIGSSFHWVQSFKAGQTAYNTKFVFKTHTTDGACTNALLYLCRGNNISDANRDSNFNCTGI